MNTEKTKKQPQKTQEWQPQALLDVGVKVGLTTGC